MKYRVKRHTVVQPQDESIRLIPLTKGQNAIVDAADYDWLMQWNWNAYWHPRTKTFYARLNHVGTHMQRVIMQAQRGQLVDHEDGNSLDNRRQNLRFATSAQNAQNRKRHSNNKSGYPGVHWMPDRNKWRASIHPGKPIHLGDFDTKEEAAMARSKATRDHFGEFSRLH